MYDDRLGLIDWIDVPQKIPGHKTSSYYMYHIQVDKTKRDNLAKYLKDKGIYTSFRYYPLHKVKYFDDGLVLKNTEDIMDKTLCLPLHQSLTDDDVNYICDILYNFNL
jgi:aminotransferase